MRACGSMLAIMCGHKLQLACYPEHTGQHLAGPGIDWQDAIRWGSRASLLIPCRPKQSLHEPLSLWSGVPEFIAFREHSRLCFRYLQAALTCIRPASSSSSEPARQGSKHSVGRPWYEECISGKISGQLHSKAVVTSCPSGRLGHAGAKGNTAGLDTCFLLVLMWSCMPHAVA